MLENRGASFLSILRKFPKLPQRWTKKRLVAVFAAWFVFAIFYPSLYGRYGQDINSIFILPLVLSGWLLGFPGGLLAAAVSVILTRLLVINQSAQPAFSSQIPGIMAAFVSGAASGWVSDLLYQVNQQKAQLTAEVAQRAQAQASLLELNNTLEQIVAARTEELLQTNEQLQTSLHEKEILLKEIHHRVKNNLQIICSLLNLQAQQLPNPQVQEMLRVSQTRVRSMALIHEKLYHSDDLAKVDCGGYINSLAVYLFQAYQANSSHVQLNIGCNPVLLDIDTAVPVGLILNELISNALKYAFPAGRTGEITVSLDIDTDRRCHLLVADNGVGLPPDLDIDNLASLGLQLVTSLVEQIDGELRIANDNGARYEIIFQVSS